MLVRLFFAHLTCSAILTGLAPGLPACSAQGSGDPMHVIVAEGATMHADNGDGSTTVPFGRTLRIEKVSSDQFQVRYEGKSWFVDKQHVMLPKDALTFIDQKIERDPSADNYGFKTHVLYSLRQFDKAVEASDKALKIDPDHITTLHYRGIASFYLDDFQEAAILLEKLMELAPDHHLTHAIDYYLKINDGDWPAAIEACKMSLEYSPYSAPSWINLGYALNRNSDLEEAMDCYRKAIECEPANSAGYAYLGFYAHSDGDMDTARKNLEKAAELNCKKVWVYSSMSAIAEQDKDSKKYRDAVKAAANCPDCTDDYLLNIAWELATSPDADRRDGEAALEFANRLIESASTDPQLVASHFRVRAAAEAELGNFMEALATLEEVDDDLRDSTWKEMSESFEAQAAYRTGPRYDF